MKYIKKTLDFNSPMLQKIKVNTNTDYMVEFDVKRDGESLNPTPSTLFVYDPKGDDNWNYTNTIGEQYLATEWTNTTAEPYTGWIKIGMLMAGSLSFGVRINNRFLNQDSWKISFDNKATWKTLRDDETIKFKVQAYDSDNFATIHNDGKVYDMDDNLIKGNYTLRWLTTPTSREDIYMWVENVAPETTLKVHFKGDYSLPTVIPCEMFRSKCVITLKASDKPNDRELIVDYISGDKQFDFTAVGESMFWAQLNAKIYIKNAGKITYDMIAKPLKFEVVDDETGEVLLIDVDMKGCVGKDSKGTYCAWISNKALNVYVNNSPVEVDAIEAGINVSDDVYFEKSIRLSTAINKHTYTGKFKLADGASNTFKCAIDEEIGDGDVGNATAEKTSNFRFVTADGDEVSIDVVIK